MKSTFAGLALLFVIVIAGCQRSSDHPGQRQEDYSDDVFRENSAPDNVDASPGSTETDAVGTEDAVLE